MRHILLCAATLTFLGCGGAIPQNEAAKPLEEVLASLDGGDRELKTARFRSLLSQLSEKFVESQRQIGDMTVKAQELMKQDGVQESLLNIMEGVNQVFPQKVENQKYAEYVSAYITLRKQGQSHSQAVSGLQELVRAITRRQ